MMEKKLVLHFKNGRILVRHPVTSLLKTRHYNKRLKI